MYVYVCYARECLHVFVRVALHLTLLSSGIGVGPTGAILQLT